MHPVMHLIGQVRDDSFPGQSDLLPEGSEHRGRPFQCRGWGITHSVASSIAVMVMGRLDELDALCSRLGLPKEADASAVVRETYRMWGPQAFAGKLCGDFALVLWDGAARRLVLARSPSGLFPLCYRQHGSVLHFASTPQDLLRGDACGVVPDEDGLAEWLVLRTRLSNRTLFEGIRRVEPGACVLFERGRLSTSTFWKPELFSTLHLRDPGEYPDALRETLMGAVQNRLRGMERCVATQLSGGLDSSSVTALAAEQLAPAGGKVFAFTAIPGSVAEHPVRNRFYDESSHAAAVAAQYPNIVHRCLDAGALSLFEVLDRYSDVEAGPPFNPHHLLWIDATYAAASETGASTMLTGSMGNTTISASGSMALPDALQHGRLIQAYKLFAADRRQNTRSFRNLPGMLLSVLAPSVLDYADRLRNLRMDVEEFTGVRPEFAESHAIDLDRWNRRMPFRTAQEQTRNAVERFDFGMFHEAPRRLYGMEVMDPTYDQRVVELSLQIPLEYFCADGVPRALIRNAMEGRLPDVVRLERRRGLQSADFLSMLERERGNIAEELDRMNQVDLVRRMLDIPLLQERLLWTHEKVAAHGWHQYSARLMRAISVGRFVRRMFDGSLFSTLPLARPDVTGTFEIAM